MTKTIKKILQKIEFYAQNWKLGFNTLNSKLRLK